MSRRRFAPCGRGASMSRAASSMRRGKRIRRASPSSSRAHARPLRCSSAASRRSIRAAAADGGHARGGTMEIEPAERERLLEELLAGRFPDAAGRFGPFGGRYVPETLMAAVTRLEEGVRTTLRSPELEARLAAE